VCHRFYSIATLAGISQYPFHHLQSVMNAAGGFVYSPLKCNHIKLLLPVA